MRRARATAGCDGVLVKPFEPQMVISRVKDLLAGGAAPAEHAGRGADSRTAARHPCRDDPAPATGRRPPAGSEPVTCAGTGRAQPSRDQTPRAAFATRDEPASTEAYLGCGNRSAAGVGQAASLPLAQAASAPLAAEQRHPLACRTAARRRAVDPRTSSRARAIARLVPRAGTAPAPPTIAETAGRRRSSERGARADDWRTLKLRGDRARVPPSGWSRRTRSESE